MPPILLFPDLNSGPGLSGRKRCVQKSVSSMRPPFVRQSVCLPIRDSCVMLPIISVPLFLQKRFVVQLFPVRGDKSQ